MLATGVADDVVAFEPHAYQNEGAKWLATKRVALLADDMGLGKTWQCLRAMQLARARSILVICPAIVREHWRRHVLNYFKNIAPSSVAVVTTTKRNWQPAPFTIISYDLAMTPAVARVLFSLRWDVCCLDEIHMLKNPNALRTRAIYAGLKSAALRVWALSATPAPNDASELWPLLRVFGATEYNYEDFIRRYCKTRRSPFGVVVTGTREDRVPELRECLANIMLRRTKKQVALQLPALTLSTLDLERTPLSIGEYALYFPEQIGLIRQVQAAARNQEAQIRAMLARSGLSDSDKLRLLRVNEAKIMSVRQRDGLEKVPALAQWIDIHFLAKHVQHKLIIFAIHRSVIARAADALLRYQPAIIHGGVNAEARTAVLDRFQKDPACRIFIGNMQACGVGIDLTAGNTVVILEPDYTPATIAQAIMRAHRIGQHAPVHCYFGVIDEPDSIDRAILGVVRRKLRGLELLSLAPENTMAGAAPAESDFSVI